MDVRIERKSRVGGNLFSLVGIVGLLAAVIAGATVWLLLTDPVTVAESMDSGEVLAAGPVARRFALRRDCQAVEILEQVRQVVGRVGTWITTWFAQKLPQIPAVEILERRGAG